MFISVKVAIISCNERIKSITDKYEQTIEELAEKVGLYNSVCVLLYLFPDG